VPLRSVEAATRDDAIAAAREQFGPSARVVGVRRVRSGGVLGFFATERYVAEVAPEFTGRPAVPVPASARPGASNLSSSPLSAAAQATAAPSRDAENRPRAAAPARNGAAAWAAEAARSPVAPATSGRPAAEPARAASPARPAAAPVHPAAAPRTPDAEEARLSELVGLLSAAAEEPAAPAFTRATFPRATVQRAPWSSASLLDEDDHSADGEPSPVLPTAASAAAPSPFTAALARMVASDRDVHQAVQDALEQPAVTRSRGDAGPWPSRSEPVGTAQTPVSPNTAHQKEETVGDQVIAPPSTNAAPSVEVPTWAAEPETAPASDSAREEAIAEVLRAALAQGHSDEALAGILRKVLAGASPQAALTSPDVAVETPVVEAPMVEAPVVETLVLETSVAEAPVVSVVEAPVAEAPVVETPLVETPAVEAPAAVAVPVAEAPVADTSVATVAEVPVAVPAAPAPLVASAPLPAAAPLASTSSAGIWGSTSHTSIWGETMSSAPLWAEPSPVPVASVIAADAPIWAEVAQSETAGPVPAAETGTAEPAPVADAVVTVTEQADELEALEAEVLEAEPIEAESVAAEFVETELAETQMAELAPMLARTASDPAPMMSFDATTVMPPLSLLPPLPSSRGRGRPPVPPTASRPPVPPSRPSAEAASPSAADRAPAAETKAEAPAPAAPSPLSLATVTRLPVAPLMTTPETPEMPELEDPTEAEVASQLPEPTVAPTTTVAPSVTPPAPAPVVPAAHPAAPATVETSPGDVAARLEALGVPARLLGATFADDVAAHGIYAALTRALGLRLRPAPELPMGAGEVLFVVGPGVETLRAARSLAATLRLDPDRVQWATRGDLAGLAPEGSRMSTIEAAIDRRHDASAAGTMTIVAVDAPLRTDAYWMAQMLAIWTPAAVWAVVEATRKPEDLEPWIESLSRVDALIVQDTDLSADPAAVLHRVTAPVALLDGVPATPHRWASLLCERLESSET
jgi:hypothetical protein